MSLSSTNLEAFGLQKRKALTKRPSNVPIELETTIAISHFRLLVYCVHVQKGCFPSTEDVAQSDWSQ